MPQPTSNWFEASIARNLARLAKIRCNRRREISVVQRQIYGRWLTVAIALVGMVVGVAIMLLGFHLRRKYGLAGIGQALPLAMGGAMGALVSVMVVPMCDIGGKVARLLWAIPLSPEEGAQLKHWLEKREAVREACERLAASHESLLVNSIDYARISRICKRVDRLEVAREEHERSLQLNGETLYGLCPQEKIRARRESQCLQQTVAPAKRSSTHPRL